MKLRYLFIFTVTTLVMFIPFVVPIAYAEDCSGDKCGLVTCSGNDCGFDDFMKMVNRVINLFLFQLAPLFATIIIVYAGFKILTSQGNSGKLTEAKKLMWNVLIGYCIALSAWLIVKLIFSDTIVKSGYVEKFLE